MFAEKYANTSEFSVYRCKSTTHCPAGEPGSCAPGRVGRGCGSCPVGFYSALAESILFWRGCFHYKLLKAMASNLRALASERLKFVALSGGDHGKCNVCTASRHRDKFSRQTQREKERDRGTRVTLNSSELTVLDWFAFWEPLPFSKVSTPGAYLIILCVVILGLGALQFLKRRVRLTVKIFHILGGSDQHVESIASIICLSHRVAIASGGEWATHVFFQTIHLRIRVVTTCVLN